MNKPVVIAGSSGLIGRSLTDALLSTGLSVKRLLRTRAEAVEGSTTWEPGAGRLEASALEGAAAVINLAGAGVGEKRWSSGRMRVLRESRLAGTRLLAETIRSLEEPPDIFISASAIGYYGERGDDELTESSSAGQGFMARLCEEWEAAAGEAQGTARTVMLRTGLVLAADGGFLQRQLPLFKLGLGGRLGSPGRWLSWISLRDTTSAIIHLINSDLAGPVNLTAPNPVTNAKFTKALAKTLRRPAALPIPAALPGLILGRNAIRALTESTRALPTRLISDGFSFQHPDLEDALAEVLRTRR